MGVCAGSRAAYTSSGNEKSSKQDEDLEALCIAEDDEKDLDTNGNSKDKLVNVRCWFYHTQWISGGKVGPFPKVR